MRSLPTSHNGGKVGKKKVAVAEQYSTHVENKIRAQSGLPLRTHYGAK